MLARMDVSLQPYPDRPSPAVHAIEVAAARPNATTLTLEYRLSLGLAGLALPSVGLPEFTDELWKHTCCEAFVRPAGGEPYVEFNLSPSKQWAAYGFSRYREGMTPLAGAPRPMIGVRRGERVIEVLALVDLAGFPMLGEADWDVGLSVVAEDEDGGVAYWALAHPGERPDFHHPASFTLRLGRGGESTLGD
jgi:hypothetical protein